MDRILAAIRQHVPRPNRLPSAPLPLRWTITKHGPDGPEQDRDILACPMGLLPHARCGDPETTAHLPGFSFTDGEVSDFADTWDTFTDPVEAVNWVWPSEDASS